MLNECIFAGIIPPPPPPSKLHKNISEIVAAAAVSKFQQSSFNFSN